MKAIKVSVSVFILLFSVIAKAQDVITFKTAEEIKAKVTEVGIAEIKYKRQDNLNGPEYTILKADVFMIKYENGTKDVFANTSIISPNYKQGCTKNEKGDYNSYMHAYHKNLVSGIVMTAIGVPMIPVGITLSAIGLSIANSPNLGMGGNSGADFADAMPFLSCGAVILAAGIAFTVIGPLKIKMAKRYKAKAKALSPTMSFNPIVAPDNYGHAMKAGAGIRINF